jgi:hypothetical protein
MTQSHTVSEEKRSLLQPPCSKCGQPMWLMRVSAPIDKEHDLRTFKCHVCLQSETVKVKFR